METMYISSWGPRRLLNITPSQPPVELPVLDLLTAYLEKALKTAVVGRVVKSHPGYYEFEKAIPVQEVSCSCGVTAPEGELYVRMTGLSGSVLPSLARHYLLWHRAEIPQADLDKLYEPAAFELYDQIYRADQEPEPLALTQKREAAQKAAVIELIQEALKTFRTESEARFLAGGLTTAKETVGVKPIGWGKTYPWHDAVEALYNQIYPGESSDYSSDYLFGKIDDWAQGSRRTHAEAVAVLEKAVQVLTSC
jgi:hypothetical protein